MTVLYNVWNIVLLLCNICWSMTVLIINETKVNVDDSESPHSAIK